MDIGGSYLGRIKKWVATQIAAHEAFSSVHHTDHQSAQAESAEFKDINIPAGEAYKQAAEIILRIKDLNTFCGEDAGKVTTGNYNNFMGYRAGYSNTTGNLNNFKGYRAGYSNTTGNLNNFMGAYTGHFNTTGNSNNFMGAYAGYFNTMGNYNNFMGAYAGHFNTTGDLNNFMGYVAGYSNTTGYLNNFMGYRAGYSNTMGNYNNFMGYAAGYSNTTGNSNNFMGAYAGYYETGSNKLFIDNAARANEADGRIKALIYGIFNAATANQLLRINGILELTEIKSGSTQALAGAGANEVWKTSGHASLPDNVLMVGV